MRTPQKIATFVLLTGLGATIYGIVRANESASAATTKTIKANAAELVDQSALRTARQLAQFADTPEEQVLAKDALRIGDRELGLAFDIALRDADAHPAELSDEAKQIQVRLQDAQKLQEGLQTQVAQLTTEAAKATGDRKEAIQDQLDIANSSLDIANDEVEDAENDLDEAGGNKKGRIAQMKKTYEDAEQQGKGAETKFPPAASEQLGLIHRFQQWSALRQKIRLLEGAKAQADAAAASAVEQHNALAAQIEAEKFNSPDLAAHSGLAGQEATPGSSASVVAQNVRKTRSHAESKEALAVTKAIADDQHNLSSFDKRADYEKQLSEIYSQWISLVSVRQSGVLKRMLVGVAIVLGLLLIGIFFNTWLRSAALA